MTHDTNKFEAGALLISHKPHSYVPDAVLNALAELEHDEKIIRQEREYLAMIHDAGDFDTPAPNTDLEDDKSYPPLSAEDLEMERETQAHVDANI